LRRFFVEKIRFEQGVCSIKGAEAKHISTVLRMGKGDRLILMDGKGRHFKAVIKSVTAREVQVAVETPVTPPASSPVEIILCQSLTRSGAMDYIIQKTSELGVNHIIPFYSERTIVRLEDNRLAKRMAHWRKIAQSSAKQSGRDVPARIAPLLSFKELINLWGEEQALKVILWEEETGLGVKTLLKMSAPVQRFTGIVGPEGGFSRKEISLAKEAGFISVSFGNRILRSETAATALVAIVQYELGDLIS
jgi:16S rRNA (uracil1498-N3)-methyltransferase